MHAFLHVCVCSIYVCLDTIDAYLDTMEQSATNGNNHTWPDLFTMRYAVQDIITCSISDDTQYNVIYDVTKLFHLVVKYLIFTS